METLFVGQNAIFLPVTESTNSYATELLKKVNPTEGTMIYTSNQTKGKGQRGNVWISDPEQNIAVSYILKPTFLSLNKLFLMYVVSALAVHDLMTELLDTSQFDIKIKWPNDILVDSKKIAGILSENVISNGIATSSIVGIGINLNQVKFNDLEDATSLALLAHHEFDMKETLNLMNKHLEHYYLKLKSKHFDWLLKTYYKHFYRLDQKQDFLLNNKLKTFEVKGINHVGLLHLQDESKEDHYFDIKEIKWL